MTTETDETTDFAALLGEFVAIRDRWWDDDGPREEDVKAAEAALLAHVAALRRERDEARRERDRAQRPPTFGELAALKEALDPLRVSPTESLDNIARRLVRALGNEEKERREWQDKHATRSREATAASSALSRLREEVEEIADDVTRLKIKAGEANPMIPTRAAFTFDDLFEDAKRIEARLRDLGKETP